MRILVVNGSPKGENSITLQTVRYLEKRFPGHEWEYLNAAGLLPVMEQRLSDIRAAFERAEMILFSYPVYTFLAPSQLHRFIGFIKENGVATAGRICTQVTTSKHFYDVTAHAYIEENAADMGMRFIRGLSADMDDLLTEQGRNEAEAWFRLLIFRAENGLFDPAPERFTGTYTPVPVDVPKRNAAPKDGDTVIVADIRPEDDQLQTMVDRFSAVFDRKTRLVNIRDYPFRGGCLSCFRCAADGKCVYTDGFDTFLRQNIQNAEAVILAFTVTDHSMGARFKMYDDRQFCNGHRTVTMGKPFGYLVSGPESRERNLDTVLRARAEVGGNFLCGIATDETDPNAEIDALAKTVAYALDHGYTQPKNFYGVGGMKIFRDLIWTMQGLMRADHKFYKANGQYDFPQKKFGTVLKMYLAGALMNSESLRKRAGNSIKTGMIAPYAKVVGNAVPAEDADRKE